MKIDSYLTNFIDFPLKCVQMEIKRSLEARIEALVGRNKVILIYGARRVGKTHMISRGLLSATTRACCRRTTSFRND